MNKAIVIILILLCYSFLFSNDFRKANWGMQMSEVKKTESVEILQETEDVLAYETTLAGFKALVIYIFAGNQLTRAKYSIIEEHTNKNDYIVDYSSLKELLTKKYGNPIEDETIWKDDLYRDKYSDWGFAISLGHLFYFSKWDTEKTEIVSVLNGENYQINAVIEYTSKNLGAEEAKMREEEALKNFTEKGFRSCEWGVNSSFVKNKEDLEIISNNKSSIIYKTSISGLNVLAGYLFTEDRLTTGRYIITESHSNKNDFISDYNSLKELLDKKFGSATKDENIWKDDLYRDKFSDWGFAVSLGHLVYYSTWSNEFSDISIILSGENYDISLMIEFKSKKLKEFENKAQEKNKLDDF
jgi:hypothetical protein